MIVRIAASLVLATLLAGCGTLSRSPSTAQGPATSGGSGGYYQDDGPGANPPADLAAIPDAVPRSEPPHRFANRPYSVLGRNYVPLAPGSTYRATGIASWYGRKFHGQATSTGETYDMYAMTAAHPTLPIPAYARVTNLANGRSVVVRVNDRGPFHSDRIIDLSYTAAWKLGYIGSGSTRVEVELLHPDGEALASTRDDDALSRQIAQQTQSDTLPTTSDAGGTWLQLGAFGSRDNAEAFLARMRRELGAEWAGRLALRMGGVLYRVQIGPFASVSAARDAAAQLQRQFDQAAVVVAPK